MGRKKKPEEHENLERWLVSYADFITLLFATFVILYALSQIDIAKFKNLKVSIREAFNSSPTILKGDPGIMSNKGQNLFSTGSANDTQNMVPPILDAIAAKEEKKQYKLIQDELKVKKINELSGIKTEVTERGLVIKMIGNIFFDPSTSGLRPESLKTVKEIGKLLKEKFPFNMIRVEGHTDNEPIHSSKFPSNWELSAYRAAGVVRYLINNVGLKKDALVAVGYGDSRPIASNDTPEGRKANRRVEIVVLRSKLLKSEYKTYQFQKERLKRLKTIEKLYQQETQKDENISDAAQKLIEKTGKKAKNVIISNDKYDKEAEKLKAKIKQYEKETSPKAKRGLFFNSVKKELKHSKS